jgi:hypothetical protein
MPLEKRPDHDLERRRGDRDPDEFFGLDIERMSPRAQLTTALAVIVPVALAGIFLFAFTSIWWIWFTFCWVIFPAFGLLVRGVAGLSEGEGRTELPAGNSKERELLGALRKHGELTSAQAAMETSVSEADRMLKELTEGGHLDVRVRGGGLFYSLWEHEDGEGAGRLEGR